MIQCVFALIFYQYSAFLYVHTSHCVLSYLKEIGQSWSTMHSYGTHRCQLTEKENFPFNVPQTNRYLLDISITVATTQPLLQILFMARLIRD